jgi:hypothetical protein
MGNRAVALMMVMMIRRRRRRMIDKWSGLECP